MQDNFLFCNICYLLLYSLVQEDEEDEDGNKPCVGLCYYRKVQAMKARQQQMDRGEGQQQDSSSQEEEEEQEPVEVIR